MKICPKCGAEYPETTTLCPSDGVALETNTDELLGQTLAAKYRIDERLSIGGMGAVYKGTHVLMDKTVAVKVLKPSLAADQKIVARFSREARAASRISHPHAISVTDFGEDENGIVFLVMEYLDGGTLKELIRREGPLPLPRVVEIIRQVGEALDAAHKQGVVHRDLKSDNIMLLGNTASDYSKVLDFGIAKIKEREGDYDPGLTAPDLVIGTPQYMSPEQCSQSPDIDARSDVYSLGVIIYEMLIGHVPFTGESPTAIMMKHLQEPAPSVLEERPDLPAAVGRVVARALEKSPGARYASAGELVDDLTVAAGMESAAEASSSDRLVAPSSAAVLEDDADEETIVRRRVTTPMPRPTAPPEPSYSAPTPIASFNPWKILIPSVVGLLVIFAAIYALTRKSATPTTEAQPTLVADPNGQPVEAASPPTGQAESGIPAGGALNPNVNASVTASPSPKESPSESETFEPNINTNTNDNTNQPSPSPTKKAEEEPPPPPTPKLPTPKPTLPPPSSPSTPDPGGSGIN